jgi:CDP-6-deoxy-D-xylo-4-hexulose-3-dehydrase
MESAIALSELENWEANIQTRRWNAEQLTGMLSNLSEFIQLPKVPAGYTHSFMEYPMVLKKEMDREAFLLYLENNGIETRYLMPLLNQPIYQKLLPGLDKKYPVSQMLSKQGSFIAIHQGLTPTDILYISNIIHDYFRFLK